VRYDTNELSSNDPIEDRHCEVLTQHGPNSCFRADEKLPSCQLSVFDGHGGSECAEVVSTLLPSYITLELDSLPPPPSTTDQPLESSDAHQARVTAVHSAIQSAFTRLDDDITNLALDMSIWGAADGSTAQSTNLVPHIRAALAGSCALVAYLEGHDLHVACVGDSRAVVGRTRKSAGGGVEAIALTEDQTGRNPKELQRMKEDHPGEESTVIMNGRVLGRLMPTRAFGDTMYKWPAHVQKAIMRNPNLPKAFLTPPYVNARPVITHRRIDPSRDRFLVLATDGLFDELDSSSVVDVVDKFM
ncbi:phosphatase 2C-like domain-containing protein, partial [Zopfochytrium polystomum]